ncbi:hypothetical protein Tco_1491947 [Tanacetum coccineum]
MANQTCSKKPLKPYAPPFYPSRFNHHHASRTNCTNKWSVHFPVATGPRNCVVPNRKPKDKPRFNKGAKRLFIKKQHHREIWKYHVCFTRKSWLLFKSKKIAQVVSAWIKSKNSLVKHFEDMRLCRPSKEYLQVWFNPPRDESMSCLTTKGMHTIGAVCTRRFRESLRRVTDGAEAFLILTLFILCLDKVSTDHAKLVPLGKVCTAKETLEKNTAKGTKCKLEPLISLTDDLSLLSNMAALESCPKHNMIAYLEKTEGNVEFHEVIDFLRRSYINHALTVSPIVSTTFVEQFWTSAKSKTINNVRHITAKVAGKFVSISEASIRTDLIFDDADGIDSLPNQAIFDAIQLMGYEGDLTVLTFNKALFSPQWRMSMSPTSREHEPCGATSRIPLLNLSGFISDQAKEIKLGRSQVNKPRSKLYLVSKQFQSISETVSLQQDSRRAHSKKIGWHKALYPNKGGKIARRIIQFKRVPLFDVNAIKGKRGVCTELEKLSTDKQIVSTNGSKVSTDEQIEGTDKQIEGTDEQIEGTEEQRESTEDKVESTAGQIEGTEDQAKEEIATQASQTSTQTPTSMIFCVMNNNYTSTSKTKKNHEPRPTSTRSLLTLKPLPKIDPKDKGKKKIEEEDESGISEDDDIPQAVKKFKQLESDDSRLGKLRKSGKLKRDKMNCEEEATNEALIKII